METLKLNIRAVVENEIELPIPYFCKGIIKDSESRIHYYATYDGKQFIHLCSLEGYENICMMGVYGITSHLQGEGLEEISRDEFFKVYEEVLNSLDKKICNIKE